MQDSPCLESSTLLLPGCRSGSMDVPGEWDEQDASPRPVGLAAAAPAATGSSETKMYTRDFLLNLQKRPQCQELPPGFERDPQLLRSEPAVSWLPPQGIF